MDFVNDRVPRSVDDGIGAIMLLPAVGAWKIGLRAGESWRKEE